MEPHMNKKDLRVDTAVVDALKNKYQITLSSISLDDHDRARLQGAWDVIQLLEKMTP